MRIDLNSPASSKNWDAVRADYSNYTGDRLTYYGDGRFEASDTAYAGVEVPATYEVCRNVTTYQDFGGDARFVDDRSSIPYTCLLLGSGRYGAITHVRLTEERAVVKITIWEIP